MCPESENHPTSISQIFSCFFLYFSAVKFQTFPNKFLWDFWS